MTDTNAAQIFARTSTLRRQIATLATDFTDAQRSHPSLCGRWSVNDVLGHLVVPLTVSLPRFALAIAKARGDFDGANDALARDTAQRLGETLPGVLLERADRRFVPPGGTAYFQLADVLIHSQDILRPLGLPHSFDEADLGDVLGFLTSPAASRGFVPRRRIEGLRFVATDLDGRAFGEGAIVEGPAEALIMAVAGRPAALPELAGLGVAPLSDRLS